MTRSANAKARVAQLTAFPSSFAPAGRAVVEGLALPFLKAPLLRWGPSCAVEYGGRPSVPPLRRFAGRRNRRIRKAMPYKRSPLQSGRVRTPAPTADVKAFLFFRRGRTLAGPLKGFCHSGPTLIRLAYARHLLPRREKAFRRLIAAPAVRRKPAGAHIMRPSSYTPGALARQNSGAQMGPHQRQFLQTQGPVARKELRKATQILRAGNFCPSQGGTPVMGAGESGLWT